MRKTSRLERGESYVVFTIEGRTATMRNSLCELAEMSANDAEFRASNLRDAGWVDVDA